jgi:hypothetical protein
MVTTFCLMLTGARCARPGCRQCLPARPGATECASSRAGSSSACRRRLRSSAGQPSTCVAFSARAVRRTTSTREGGAGGCRPAGWSTVTAACTACQRAVLLSAPPRAVPWRSRRSSRPAPAPGSRLAGSGKKKRQGTALPGSRKPAGPITAAGATCAGSVPSIWITSSRWPGAAATGLLTCGRCAGSAIAARMPAGRMYRHGSRESGWTCGRTGYEPSTPAAASSETGG